MLGVTSSSKVGGVLVLGDVTLGVGLVVEAAGSGAPVVPLDDPNVPAGAVQLKPSDLDASDTDITKWKKNGDVYQMQHQSIAYDSQYEDTLPNRTPCVMTVPVEVGAGAAELMFDWKVSSEEDYDLLSFELKDADRNVLTTLKKSGVETAFDTVKVGSLPGNYTLTFTYQGDDYGWWDGDDAGYVTNIYLVPASGVSGISKTMFALPSDLISAEYFSLSFVDFRPLGGSALIECLRAENFPNM